MIDFELPESAAAYLDRLRVFVDEHIIPEAEGLEPDAELVTGRVGEEVLPKLRKQAQEMEVYLPNLPPEHGGQGVSLTTLALAAEICGPYPLASLAINCMAPDEGNMHLLHAFGTPEQKERWLAPLAAGDIHSCFGMAEPDAGSDPRRATSRAEQLPDGGWLINSHKVFTSGAHGASLCIVMAVTDPDLPAHAGQSMFLVPTDAPGFEIVRDLKTMGMHGFAGHPETRCTDVELPADAMLGERGKGFAIAQSRLGAGRMGHAMRWIGVGQKALDLAANRALNRETFGEPLAARQAVQWWLADGATLLYASRLMVLHTCWKVDQGLPHRTEVSMVKTFVAEALGQIVDHALQVFGGWGYTQDYPLEKWYRDARAARIYDGPSEVHRMLVARQIFREVEGTGTAANVGRVLEISGGDRRSA